MRALHCHARLEVVPGATHLFEEPGALETVAHLAGRVVRHPPARAGAGMRVKAFADRSEAGRALAARLAAMAIAPPVVVLALPRGGVPVAAEVARTLGAPLDLLLVRKIGAPWQPELAVAAVVDGDPPDIVVDELTSRMSGVDRDYIDREAGRELQEIERRRQVYLAGRKPVPVAGATVIVVDDGIATGTTVRAALKALAPASAGPHRAGSAGGASRDGGRVEPRSTRWCAWSSRSRSTPSACTTPTSTRCPTSEVLAELAAAAPARPDGPGAR